ncbi:MAG: methylmalonyl-CoA mutase [Flavobacteriaceae bacterium]|jgi:methylmalonyl-CoA mutase
MSDYLFKEFDEVSSKEWKQKIQVDLKGADYNETLIWKNLEGIDVKPFYHQDEFKADFKEIPEFPKDWNVAQSIFIDDEKIANHLIVNSIKRGAEAIVLTANNEFNIEQIFNDFSFENTIIYFDLKFLSESFISNLKQFFSNKKASVFYNIDIIGNLAKSGNWYSNLKEDHSTLAKIIEQNPQENIVSVDGTLFQNSGATMVQQLAYCLSQANEYLNHFKNTPLSKNNTFSITFKLSLGSNYFFEIAKIRALRKLYALLANEYSFSTECHIITFPSNRNKTIYDYNINMLRTTTENMSAIIGGSNTVCNNSYDSIFHKSNEFGERIARNQLLILKQESYFEASNNPAKGSYYIETITNQISEKALILFKNIEANGGFLSQLKEGTIQRKLKESAQKEQGLFDIGALELLGTNVHQNPNDKMKDDLELFPFMKKNTRKTLIEPILERRLSEKNEQERLKTE